MHNRLPQRQLPHKWWWEVGKIWEEQQKWDHVQATCLLVTSAKGGVWSPEQEVVSAIACLRTTVRGNLFSLSWISIWFPPSQLPQQSVPSFYRNSAKMYFLLFVPNLLMAGVPLVLTVWEILKNVYFFHVLCGIPNSMDPDGICRSL